MIGGSVLCIGELLWFLTGKFSLVWWGANKVDVRDPKWALRNEGKEGKIQKLVEGWVCWEEFQHYVE